jgi:hypothetical protein
MNTWKLLTLPGKVTNKLLTLVSQKMSERSEDFTSKYHKYLFLTRSETLLFFSKI